MPIVPVGPTPVFARGGADQSEDYPDGDALRRTAAPGANTSRPRKITFLVVVPHSEAGRRVAR